MLIDPGAAINLDSIARTLPTSGAPSAPTFGALLYSLQNERGPSGCHPGRPSNGLARFAPDQPYRHPEQEGATSDALSPDR